MTASPDLIGLLEAAYDGGSSEQTWIERLAHAAVPLIPGAVGATALALRPVGRELYSPNAPRTFAGMTNALESAMREASESEFQAEAISLACAKPVTTARAELGDHYASMATQQTLASLGAVDVLSISGWNQGATGAALFVALSERLILTPALVRRWARVSAHLASAARLRELEPMLAYGDEPAVLSPNGRLEHVREDADSARTREALRDAGRSITRARGTQRKSAPDDALGDWRALVDGRFTLIDSTDSDGRRFFVARENSPRVFGPVALTERERLVAAHRARGHSLKFIGYELGLAPSTVWSLLATARTKLGVRDDVALARAMAAPRETASSVLQGLTDAEIAVALLLLRGLSQARIAHVRDASARTIANQVGSIYKKLGITSRNELAARVGPRVELADASATVERASGPRSQPRAQ